MGKLPYSHVRIPKDMGMVWVPLTIFGGPCPWVIIWVANSSYKFSSLGCRFPISARPGLTINYMIWVASWVAAMTSCAQICWLILSI